MFIKKIIVGFLAGLVMLMAPRPVAASGVLDLRQVITTVLNIFSYNATVADYGKTVPPVVTTGEWTQHAHDAQHTSYTDQSISLPWRWKWLWNGSGFGLPRNSQPITGGGRVYVAAGSRGVYVLNNTNGSQVCNFSGTFNSTPAYSNESVFALATNGTLYKFNAANCSQQGTFTTGGSSTLPLPPAIANNRVFIVGGSNVYAVDTSTMQQIWSYAAGSAVHTPAAYSPSRNSVVVVTQDLYVHAINNTNGARIWRTKPTPRTGGNPGDGNSDLAEASEGWPVIAEVHGYVLVKYRLDWQTLWTWSPWPASNATMRSNLTAQPNQQALFAMSLDNGSTSFISNVGHGGFGDGGYLPMGPQPVVKRFANGQEVAYIVMRTTCLSVAACDGRGDSRLGEMILDSTTISGYQAGYVRAMTNTFFPTDEQANLSMAGNQIFGGHWMFGLAHLITDRSATKGSVENPIAIADLPHIITSTSSCNTGSRHYCSGSMTQDGDARTVPSGFYLYRGQGTVYDDYWSEYAAWVVSGNTIYYVSTDGAVVALEAGSP
jgi:outer membrane protein assembly factor BamB